MMNKFNLLFITFFKIGKIKFAPGTFASFITCLLFLLFVNLFNIVILLFCTLLIAFYSFISINNSFDSFDSNDHKEIVIDEVVVQMLPLLSVPIYETLYIAPKEYYCIAAFILFRLFDIWKPFPINYIDINTVGSLGIMLDDILAGIYTFIILIIIFFFIGA